jgi:hypothetical protein
MRLARRLTLFMIAGSWWSSRVTRCSRFGANARCSSSTPLHDHEVLGRALAATFDRIWQLDGKRRRSNYWSA